MRTTRGIPVAMMLAAILVHGNATAQTTAGASATIVVPIVASTNSYSTVLTAFNPNALDISVTATLYDALDTSVPGAKACSTLSIPGATSVEFDVAAQCALPEGSNFGLLVLAEQTGTHAFYGYARTQTPAGVGFSTEGFPIENFNDQLQNVAGLKRTAAAGNQPAFQTNCFVATLGDGVDYELRLFDGTTQLQVGHTLTGTLGPYQQVRYLDVFTRAYATAGDYRNVRAEFTNLSAQNRKLVGFCTVQENGTFSADFRIAKSYGGTPQNAFVQGGNAFGTTALLGTVDEQPVDVIVNGERVMRYEWVSGAPNVIGGYSGNSANGNGSVTIAGGGFDCPNNGCSNQATAPLVTIGGGYGNFASSTGATIAGGFGHVASGYDSTIGGGTGNVAGDAAATVAGGSQNKATGFVSTIGGGSSNVASGSGATVVGGANNTASGSNSTVSGGNANSATGFFAVVAGGGHNVASGGASFVAGRFGKATGNGTFVWADLQPNTNVFEVADDNVFAARATGGVWFVTAVDDAGAATKSVTIDTSGNVNASGTFNGSSDRNAKDDVAPVDSLAVLAKLSRLPITTWRYKTDAPGISHMGPMSQDFRAAFSLGSDDRHIATVDADGVALAAIQGLYRLLEARDREIADLRERLIRLEAAR